MRLMPRPRPPHLHRETSRHGKTVWYVRLDRGHRIRIRSPFGSPEFEVEYRAALEGDRPPPASRPARGTLEWLWLLYRQSAAWLDLALATRKQRENIMFHVLKTAGREPLSRITRKAILDGRDRRAGTPSQAKNFLSTMRGLFTWAIDCNLIATDPTQGIKTKRAKVKSDGFPVWNDDEIAAFEKRWPRGTRQRVMFDVFLYTGLRRGDAAVVGWQHVKNGVISLQTEKTGIWVHIPILPELHATLQAGPTGDLAFIANSTNGNPLTKEALGTLFAEACRAAGVPKSAHGLRKAAATNAANHGATVAELEAIFGWQGGQMASLYTRSANRRLLSATAMTKLSRTETETSIPSPGGQVRAPEQKP